MPLPKISRAVIVLHGRLRNADVYYRSALTAQTAAGDEGKATLMIVPQFLAEIDVEAHKLPADTLRWSLEGWEGGDAALAPNPVSSFEALDAILAKLSDRRIFPNLKQVVVAGHSGGGQVAQRYAIAGKGARRRCCASTSRSVTSSPIPRPTPISTTRGPCRPSPHPARATTTGNTAWTSVRPILRTQRRSRSRSAMSSAR